MSSYIKRVEPLITVNSSFHLLNEDLWKMLDNTKPIMFDGHFELLSGKHSDMFFRFAAISKYPRYVSDISMEMIACIQKKNMLSEIDVVLGTTSQGMFFAFDMASKINKKVAYALFDEGTGKPIEKLVEGFNIERGERVLIVNDLTTTGTGINTLKELVEDCHAKVIGVCLFANRGCDEDKVKDIRNKIGFFHSVIDIKMPSWPNKIACPQCNGEKPSKPIICSKELHHLPIYSKEDEFERIIKYRQEHQYHRQEYQSHCN